MVWSRSVAFHASHFPELILVQVIKTVTAIVDHLPPDAFEPEAPSTPFMSSQDSFDNFSSNPTVPTPPANAQETARNNIVREIVETERKYVQDLEILQVRAVSSLLGDRLLTS